MISNERSNALRRMLAAVGLVAAGVGCYLVLRGGRPDHAFPDPRITYEGPYLNVRPGVAYVDDDKHCGRCHPSEWLSFRQHPMGTSAGVPGQLHQIEEYEKGTFVKGPFRYLVRKTKNEITHVEQLVDGQGKVLYEFAKPIAMIIGSGARSRSYLVNEDGTLFLSPIGWFTQKGIWELSPGYEKSNPHFQRPILNDCLHCHTNRVEAVPGTANEYRGDLVHDLAIGCQRCHGPGELHVKAWDDGGAAAARTIVNPRKLEPLLRDAVCEQCHLDRTMVLRQGRSMQEFRPGLPLSSFGTYFIHEGEHQDELVGQVEQMHLSTCFKKSAGKLGCISCHDPHYKPTRIERAAYFRDRCQACHQPDQSRDCLESPMSRSGKGNDCVACHMPTAYASDVVHVSITDHRVPRTPAAAPRTRPKGGSVGAPFHPYDSKDPEITRAYGLHLVSNNVSPQAGRGLRFLEATLAMFPKDWDSLDAKARALRAVGRKTEAVELFDAILASQPHRVMTLRNAASLHLEYDRLDKASDYLQRAAELQPLIAAHHLLLALVHLKRKNHDQAIAEARACLRLNPAEPDARFVLIEALLKTGQPKEAEAEIEQLEALQPPDIDAMRRAIQELLRARPAPPK